jgi:hypothetical protein
MQKNTGEQKEEYCYNRPCNFVFGNDTHYFDAQNAFMLVIRLRRAGIISLLVTVRNLRMSIMQLSNTVSTSGARLYEIQLTECNEKSFL